MYRALVGIGVVCGLLIVTVYQLTLPIIEANKAEALRAAVFDVLPEAATSETFVLAKDGSLVPEAEAKGADLPEVHAGFDDSGALVGFAIEARGMGYQDIITVLYGYDPEADTVIGMRVLESRETPGLGDKIEKDGAFLANFDALDVSLNDAGDDLAHQVEAVKHGEKSSPWQIDAITGATISSFAIGDILRKSTSFWIPRLAPKADQIQRSEP
jgi:electron transport complex protein RnfG